MKTFILFIFGLFDDHEDIEYFCTDILGVSDAIKSVRFVIENSQNIIVIFDSDYENQKLANELYNILTNDNIKLYFIFDRDSLVTAHLPRDIKDFIFKPITDNMVINMNYTSSNKSILDLDLLLDKIEEKGIDSLTPEEKNFLDNFEK